MSLDANLREMAYNVWSENQQNVAKTARLLKDKFGQAVTRPTLIAWRDAFGWEDRAARAEAQGKQIKDSGDIDNLLLDLIARKSQYDLFFESLAPGRVDNQATYAYAGLVKKIAEIQTMKAAGSGTYDRAKVFLENIQWLVGWFKANDPDGLLVLARNIDALTTAYKADCL